MPRDNPFAVDFVPERAWSFSLLELLLMPVVIAAAYVLVHQLRVLAIAFYLGLFVIDCVICFFDASQKQPAEASYRAGRWRRRILSAILGATFGVVPLYLVYVLLCYFYPPLAQTPLLQVYEILSTVGAGLGYCFPRLAYGLLWLVAVVLRLA
jgi:uncharacterized membrane protein (DUF485 family)